MKRKMAKEILGDQPMSKTKIEKAVQKNILDSADLSQEYVKMGEIVITKTPERYNLLGLGTCLGIFMYDLQRGSYALAHTLLPTSHNRKSSRNINKTKISPARFTDEGIRQMIRKLVRMGSNRQDLRVKIAGGSKIFNDSFEVGQRNTDAARRVLLEEGIDLVKEEVGGSSGRSIVVFNRDGSLLIRQFGEIFKI